jgi:hypothetical protein
MSCHVRAGQGRAGQGRAGHFMVDHLYSERITVSSVSSRFYATNAARQRDLYQVRAIVKMR